MQPQTTTRHQAVKRTCQLLIDAGEYDLAVRLFLVTTQLTWMKYKKDRHNRKHEKLTATYNQLYSDIMAKAFNLEMHDL